MSIKSKVLAAAATLTMAGGLSTAGTLPATAATPQCGQRLHPDLQRQVRHERQPRLR